MRASSSRSWLADAGLVTAGAVAMVLAVPPANAWPIGLVAWVPLSLVASAGAPRRAAIAGWAQGALAQSMALLAIPGALREGGGTSVGWSCALAFLLALWEGGRFGVIGFVTARSVRTVGRCSPLFRSRSLRRSGCTRCASLGTARCFFRLRRRCSSAPISADRSSCRSVSGCLTPASCRRGRTDLLADFGSDTYWCDLRRRLVPLPSMG